MYPFWDAVIEPALTAVAASRVVEIGAQRGETTVRLMDLLGADAELHVIDPVPLFDPAEHSRRFPGRYVFHRGTSHDILPELGPCDAALIDGDHNWFTVYHELILLRDAARRAGEPLPLILLHDVGWPYGRRDLYYAPERIPAEFRRPHRRLGIRPGRPELVEEGGLNQHLHNALEEGGPRNGVRCALEDFTAEYDRPLRTVVLPIYFGLALVAERELIGARPDLGRLLDRLEGADGRRDLLELSESIRIREQVLYHELVHRFEARPTRVARRYVDGLKHAFLA